MGNPRIITFYSSWASPYATTLQVIGDDNLLDMLQKGEEESIVGVAVDVAKDGNNVFWRVAPGGPWTFVKVPGDGVQLEGYPHNRKPVDGMKYLPLLPGERFEGKVEYGKRRSYSVYSVVITVEGVILEPIDRESWGDRAYDISGKSYQAPAPVEPEPQPYTSTATAETDDSPMAVAMRKAGLIP